MALTEQGLEIKDFNEILSEMKESLRSKLGVQIDTETGSVIDQIYSPVADQINDAWQALLSVHQADDPNTASGESLDRICEQVGVTRLPATRSVVEAQSFIGDNNTSIPAGSILEVDGTEERFSLISTVLISTASCISVTVEITTVSDNTEYTATVEGFPFSITSDADATAEEIAAALVQSINSQALLTATATDNLDGTFKVEPDDGVSSINCSFGPGQSVASVTSTGEVESENFGPILAPSGTLNKIITPVIGWNSTINPLDAAVGRDIETDPALRVRRSQSLAITGQSTVPAIRAKLAQLDGVEAAIVVENDQNVADLEGRPPKSFESIVLGGLDLEIAETIWNNKPVGIETFGSTEIEYVDSEGISRFIQFSRPTEVYIHIRVSYTKYNEESFPSTGETAMQSTVLDEGNALSIGNDVLPERFKGPIFTNVSGIAELTIEVATSAAPLDPPGAYQTSPLAISGTEVPVFDSSRIIIQEV